MQGYYPSMKPGCEECPVENVSWHEAAAYLNGLSEAGGYERCYECNDLLQQEVSCELSRAYGTPYECPGYRLPMAAEWEYAARAGTATATYNGNLEAGHLLCEEPNGVLDSIAWFCGNSGSTTHAVGGKLANAWGLYDTLGNVFEWVNDWSFVYPESPTIDPWESHTGSGRVFRGGSFDYYAKGTRAAFRFTGGPSYRFDYLGFRPARSVHP
jgi:formylglycine-generating enzyme required for sulfatase activity